MAAEPFWRRGIEMGIVGIKGEEREQMDENRNVEVEQDEAVKVDASEVLKAKPAETGKPQSRKKKFWKEVKEWIVALAVALLVVLVIQSFLFRIIRVDGHSMDTTLADGERLFVTVADVKFGDVERNSVVICHYPNRGWTYFVKRCVGLPGDTVYRENGVTHVVYEENGETVDEALDERYALYNPFGSVDDYEPYVLGEDEYFVVGDNRYNSHDSRDWKDSNSEGDVGPISKKMIVGRVRNVIWPLGNIRTVE